MKWETFVEKVNNDWSYETAANRISMLEQLGTPEEIAELVQYALDEKGVVKLLKRAMAEDVHFTSSQILSMAECMEEEHADVLIRYFLNQGKRFSTEDAVGMIGSCSDPMLNEVVRHADAPFTLGQIEELDGYVDEDLIRELYASAGVPLTDEEDEGEFVAPNEPSPSDAAAADVSVLPEQQPTNAFAPKGQDAEKNNGLLHAVRKSLFPKKYIYVFVLFKEGTRTYAYRTTDKTIKAGEVVVVPVGDHDQKAAYVSEVRVVTEDQLPYPLEQTKLVLGRAKKKETKELLDDDLRVPMDISYYRVKTEDGVKEVVTTESARKMLRQKYQNHPRVKPVETRKPAKPKNDQSWIDELEFFDAIFDDR